MYNWVTVKSVSSLTDLVQTLHTLKKKKRKPRDAKWLSPRSQSLEWTALIKNHFLSFSDALCAPQNLLAEYMASIA